MTEHRARKDLNPRIGRIVIAPLPVAVTAAGLVGPELSALAADGKQNNQIAETLGAQSPAAGRWGQRSANGGLAGIEKDAPRSGRKPT